MNAPFDTLKLAKGLQAAGMEAAVAQGTAEVLSTAMAETDFATKSDIAKLSHDIDLLRRDMTIKLGSFMMIGVGIILAAIRFMPRM